MHKIYGIDFPETGVAHTLPIDRFEPSMSQVTVFVIRSLFRFDDAIFLRTVNDDMETYTDGKHDKRRN